MSAIGLDAGDMMMAKRRMMNIENLQSKIIRGNKIENFEVVQHTNVIYENSIRVNGCELFNK